MSRFVKLRSGIFDHLQSGKLAPREFIVMLRLIDLADAASGVWSGCAIALAKKCGPSFNLSGTRKLISALEKRGYIRRFRTEAQRGNSPVAINRFLVTAGPNAGKYLITAKSQDEDSLCYERVHGKETETVADKAEGEPIHPEAIAMGEILAAAGRKVHPISLRAMSGFLNEKSYDDEQIAQMKKILNWALTHPYWYECTPCLENFIKHIQFDRPKGLRQQYFAAQKKISKRKTSPAGAGKKRVAFGNASQGGREGSIYTGKQL